jgi:hypothetical protein
VRLENAVPPTLSAGSSLLQTATPTVMLGPPPSPSPGIAASPAPSGSPGLSPIISGLQPAPGATLPAGDVVISARVSGSTDLVDVTAFVDGEAVTVEPVGPSVRVKIVSFVRTFLGGTHEVRIQARDEKGQLGGYRWQFTVGAARQPAEAPTTTKPVAPTSAVQTRTPIPLPTRRPTVVLPTPLATPAGPVRQ